MNTNTSKIKVEIIHSINKYGCQKWFQKNVKKQRKKKLEKNKRNHPKIYIMKQK